MPTTNGKHIDPKIIFIVGIVLCGDRIHNTRQRGDRLNRLTNRAVPSNLSTISKVQTETKQTMG